MIYVAILFLLALIVAFIGWPERCQWEEFGDGYLYVYTDPCGRTLGEVYVNPRGYIAHVKRRKTRFSTLAAAMRHVETSAK